MTLSIAEINDSQWSIGQIAFYEEFIDGTTAILRDTARLWNGEVTLDISLTGSDTITLDRMIAKTTGVGHGRQAFQWLKKLAQTHNISISLTPAVIAHPSDKNKPTSLTDETLERFYESEGCIRRNHFEWVYTPYP